MKRKIYIETSVASYLVSRPSKDIVIAGHQETTKAFWRIMERKFNAYISDLVIQEAGKGDPAQAALRLEAIKSLPVLDVDDEIKSLARKIIKGRGIPENCTEDALHIAFAAVNVIDAIVTWNFSHINNPFTKMMIRQIVENEGYICPEICSPDELLGDLR